MVVLDQVLYVGGGFSMIASTSRNHLAAFDRSNGALTAWNPDANDNVSVVTGNGSMLYVGGNFTHVGGEPRPYLAALNTSTGTATGWNPAPAILPPYNSGVASLAVAGETIYVGGYFDSIGGAQRHNIAAIDTASGLATDWNPGANDLVDALAVDGNFVYAGGVFDNLGGQHRQLIGAINRHSGAVVGWNLGTWSGSYVDALELANDKVYAGGLFTVADYETRQAVVSLRSADNVFLDTFEP